MREYGDCAGMALTKGLAAAGGCLAVGILVILGIRAQRSGLDRIPRAQKIGIAQAGHAAAASPSTLWVLAIGVSRYRETDLNLLFADSDARAIAAAFQEQRHGRVYRDVHTLVLVNDQVTRESILDSMESFLGRAAVDDVVVIFLAGHGVQDAESGSYYFLPSSATAENLVTAGLRMSDFDEMVRIVRRNVRAVVLMLDTCHAGALRLSASGLVPGSDSGMRISTGEGFFLLAASKPGEDSKERAELGHGAFTSALLAGLHGAADNDGDGLLPLSELFGYVARHVPQLTGGAQHPYHKMEGTDLVLAAVRHGGATQIAQARATAPFPVANAATTPLPTPPANTIGVVEFRDLRAAPEHDWIGKAVRVALNTELSKVRALRVYSPEIIDRSAGAQPSNILDTAQRLGIRKLLTGSFHVLGNTVRIDAEIVDTTTGVQEGSDSVQGSLDDFFALQKKLVLSMLRRLPVDVSPAEDKSIQTTTNTSINAYRLLLESEGLVEEQPARGPTPTMKQAPGGPESRRTGLLERFAAGFVRCAYAADEELDVAAQVRRVLEEYRVALQTKNLDRLAAVYMSFSSRQRAAVRAYLENAVGLTVEFSDFEIEPRGPEVVVSYTRRDHFTDRVSAKTQALEVRLTKIMVHQNGQWKIASGRQ
jgi:TolB-like protein